MKSPQEILIGIIGGKGEMGNWFARFFRDQGFLVQISDIGTELTNAQIAKTSDVVIFSVPIGVTVDVIEELLPHSNSKQLWMDLTSIKAPAVAAMKKSKAEVLGTHPLFGPSAKEIRGQSVIFCPIRLKNWKGWFEGLLVKSGAKTKTLTAEDHDRLMAVMQGLTHFTAITLNYTFQKLNFSVEESLPFTSPIYRMHLEIGGRILAQNPRLYAEIQSLNPEVTPVLDAYLEACTELTNCARNRDLNGFQEIFQTASDHLGPFRDRALEESDALIDLLVQGKQNPLTTYPIPPTSLQECRERIDEVDRAFARLLTERMQLSTCIAEFKKESSSPIEDQERERKVLERYQALAGNPLSEKDIEKFVSLLVGISKKVQRELP